MKQKNSLVMIFILCGSIFLFTGCSRKTSSVDFSEVNNICELATLKCYYHNVAKDILEAYVKNVGKQMGQEYTVEWKESE